MSAAAALKAARALGVDVTLDGKAHKLPYVANRLPTCSLKFEFSLLNANLMVPVALPLMYRCTISVN
jgi:hypothetical protein